MYRRGFQSQADARTRTGDPFITSEVLYQLSYVGRAPTVARPGFDSRSQAAAGGTLRTWSER